MKTKKVLGDEHLVRCGYGEVEDCYCFWNEEFVDYFIKKYPNHMATIAYIDKNIEEIYGE